MKRIFRVSFALMCVLPVLFMIYGLISGVARPMGLTHTIITLWMGAALLWVAYHVLHDK